MTETLTPRIKTLLKEFTDAKQEHVRLTEKLIRLEGSLTFAREAVGEESFQEIVNEFNSGLKTPKDSTPSAPNEKTLIDT